jgi:hypothetical protein
MPQAPNSADYNLQVIFHQDFSDLDAVECGALAHIIGNHPEV